VIASIFNGSGYSQSSGGGGLTFTAYNVDATAAATTTEEWPNTVNANYSHTVLIEEGTGTWCPYCPAMKNALKSIYDSHLYPMFFVALVEDMSTKANYRCTHDYNIYGYPTAFFDGGYRVKVGGDPVAANYISLIQECGARAEGYGPEGRRKPIDGLHGAAIPGRNEQSGATGCQIHHGKP